MDEQIVEHLRDTLVKLSKLEDVIKKDKGITEELLDIQMLVEFIKEQLPYEDTLASIG